MQCLGQTVRAMAANMVLAPIPKALLEARRNNRPLAPGGGLGGRLLGAAIQEDNALLAMQHDIFTLGELIETVGVQMKELDQIDAKVGANQRQIDFQISAAEARKAGGIFGAIVNILSKAVSIALSVASLNPVGVLGDLANATTNAVQSGVARNRYRRQGHRCTQGAEERR